MDSGTEVLRVTTAIVSAFQTAADAVEFIKDRKDRRKRKKDVDIEELLEIKILHRSLVEGGTRCRKHCANRHQQYGSAFEAGDDMAKQALQEVVISLQTEIIQPLHIARAVENATLDVTALHESSISNRKDAMRAMDQLCQRIMASTQYLPQHGAYQLGAVGPSNMSIQSSSTSVPVSDIIDSYEEPSSIPPSIGSPTLPYETRAFSQRTFSLQSSVYEPEQMRYPQPPQKSPLAWIANRVDAPQVDPLPRLTVPIRLEQSVSYQSPDDAQGERMSYLSTTYTSSISDRGSMNLQPVSDTPASTPRYSQDPPSRVVSTERPYQDRSPMAGSPSESRTIQRLQQTHEQLQTMHQKMRDLEIKKQDYGGYFGGEREREETQSMMSKPLPPAPSLGLVLATADRKRASVGSEAPEVIKAYTDDAQALSPREDTFSEKEPSPRLVPDYNARLLSLPLGMESIWVPLTRPAMHNRYHGFCKGAWQIRKSVSEGLEVQVTPALKEPTLHWACKECKFKSRAPNSDSLPDQVMSNQKYNIRFRWLFLAKSHRSADASIDVLEGYKYGCIFCAAEGKTTAVHDRLDHLMVHIVSKHKPITMTPDIRAKTKCVVGNVAHNLQDWDIHVPDSIQKAPTVATDKFLISASKFFGKKGKR